MNETNIFSTASHKLFGPVKRIGSKIYYTDSVGLPVRTCFQMFIRDFLPEAVHQQRNGPYAGGWQRFRLLP